MATKTNALTEGSAPNIDVQNINFSANIGYVDVSDPDNPKRANYNENVNINFANEPEMNRILTEKPYLVAVLPILASRLIQGYDPENSTAKQLKADVKNAIKPV